MTETAEIKEFNSLNAVALYLDKQGYKIKKSTIYNHKTEGKIRPNKEGKYSIDAINKYARIHLPLIDGSAPPFAKGIDKAQQESAEAATRERIARARHWELRADALEQKLVPRELFENELAARAAIFRTDGENFFRSNASALVNIVNGDPGRIPDLIELCLNEFDKWLARYLRKEEFKVDVSAYEKIFERAGKDETDDDTTDEDD